VGVDNIWLWLSAVKLIFILECGLVYEDMVISAQNRFLYDVHIDQFSKILSKSSNLKPTG
jgi:hypothetical protein